MPPKAEASLKTSLNISAINIAAFGRWLPPVAGCAETFGDDVFDASQS